MALVHMHKKFEINQTNIKGGCQLERKVVPHDSKSDLPTIYVHGRSYPITHLSSHRNG